jgi:hypothetical protein
MKKKVYKTLEEVNKVYFPNSKVKKANNPENDVKEIINKFECNIKNIFDLKPCNI